MAVGSVFSALGSALYAAIGTAAGTVAPMAVYQGMAPQGSVFPYAMFNQQTARDEYTFTSRGMTASYQVKVVSNRQSDSEARAAYDRLHANLQDAPLTVTGYTLMRMRRETTIEYQDPDRFWHVGGIYRIDIEEA
jgi:hypothetical protein